MKKLLVIGVSALLLTACNSSTEKTASEGKAKQETVKKEEQQVTVSLLIEEFKKAGLQAENATDLPEKEFGPSRKEGKRILVPSLGDDAGGRLYEFPKTEDLEKAKAYYDELGKNGPLFFSHTYAKGNFLLQMNGDMEDAEFAKYKAVMDSVIK